MDSPSLRKAKPMTNEMVKQLTDEAIRRTPAYEAPGAVALSIENWGDNYAALGDGVLIRMLASALLAAKAEADGARERAIEECAAAADARARYYGAGPDPEREKAAEEIARDIRSLSSYPPVEPAAKDDVVNDAGSTAEV